MKTYIFATKLLFLNHQKYNLRKISHLRTNSFFQIDKLLMKAIILIQKSVMGCAILAKYHGISQNFVKRSGDEMQITTKHREKATNFIKNS